MTAQGTVLIDDLFEKAEDDKGVNISNITKATVTFTVHSVPNQKQAIRHLTPTTVFER